MSNCKHYIYYLKSNSQLTQLKNDSRTIQDVDVKALAMCELWKQNASIACLPEIRIPDSDHSVIKAPGEDACYRFYHSGVVDSNGSHGVNVGLGFTVTSIARLGVNIKL